MIRNLVGNFAVYGHSSIVHAAMIFCEIPLSVFQYFSLCIDNPNQIGIFQILSQNPKCDTIAENMRNPRRKMDELQFISGTMRPF